MGGSTDKEQSISFFDAVKRADASQQITNTENNLEQELKYKESEDRRQHRKQWNKFFLDLAKGNKWFICTLAIIGLAILILYFASFYIPYLPENGNEIRSDIRSLGSVLASITLGFFAGRLNSK